MNDKNIEEKLRTVFSDAHVIDVDFSEWDKVVSLVVVADHLRPIRGHLQLICVTFAGVKRASFRFPRIGKRLSKGEHFQWWTTWVESKELAIGRRFVIGGDASMPRVEIVCDGVNCSRIDGKVFQGVNPEWGRPAGGLARPSIQKLFALRSMRRRRL